MRTKSVFVNGYSFYSADKFKSFLPLYNDSNTIKHIQTILKAIQNTPSPKAIKLFMHAQLNRA